MAQNCIVEFFFAALAVFDRIFTGPVRVLTSDCVRFLLFKLHNFALHVQSWCWSDDLISNGLWYFVCYEMFAKMFDCGLDWKEKLETIYLCWCMRCLLGKSVEHPIICCGLYTVCLFLLAVSPVSTGLCSAWPVNQHLTTSWSTPLLLSMRFLVELLWLCLACWYCLSDLSVLL